MSNDLTIIYYTSNFAPKSFLEKIRGNLLKVKSSYPLISVSQRPIDFGINICVGNIGRSTYNIYKQILIGAKKAKTEYIATAEDDVLYSKEHFDYRPLGDIFAYDTAKWSIYSWIKPPVFTYKENRKTMTSLIVRKDILVKTLEQRFNKYPDKDNYPQNIWGEPGRYEEHLGIDSVKVGTYLASVPSIVFNTENSLQFSVLGKRKKMGIMKAYNIPIWGKAEDILKVYID